MASAVEMLMSNLVAVALLPTAAIALAPSAKPAAPFYYTCRHGYETTLSAELKRGDHWSTVSMQASGLVKAVPVGSLKQDNVPDATYALQVLPHAIECRGASIKELASAATATLQLAEGTLGSAPRGSLVVHTLVPDLLRGVPPSKAKLLSRCDKVADQVRSGLKARFACARSARLPAEGEASASDDGDGASVLVLQVLLLEPECVLVSLARATSHSRLGRWPSALPGGLDAATLLGKDLTMPSSAYRKLLESFACLEAAPTAASSAVDLGACPGGWTAALRKLGCSVVAVDRSPLADELMRDEGVTFVQVISTDDLLITA